MHLLCKRKREESTVEKFLRKRIRIEDPHAALKHLNILTVSEIEEVAKSEGIKAADLAFMTTRNSARINQKIAIPPFRQSTGFMMVPSTTKPKTVNGWRGLVLVDDTGKEE